MLLYQKKREILTTCCYGNTYPCTDEGKHYSFIDGQCLALLHFNSLFI